MVGKRDGDGEARGKKTLGCRILHVSPGQSRFNGREERQGRRGARQEVILLRQSETELYFHHFHPSRVAGPETTQWYGRETETERREARSDSNATI
ncbi:hypothetical protein J6590_016294 [Homalodisca vitripennis]|nr:hypothetical protein J6590_016294 [Homalodisca vitripennis]